MTTHPLKLGFVGLGIMGTPMAGHLLHAGHQLFVHTLGKLPPEIAESRATVCTSARGVAERADIVFLMVPDTPDVEAALFSESGVASGLTRGKIVVDMSSISPIATKDFAARIQATGCDYLDAPVSGGEVGAKNATLSIMVGGETSAFERAKPVLEVMGKTIVHQGPAGAGQYAKLCNQIAIASTMLSVCESMAFAKAAGLDPNRVLENITTGAANSWCLSQLMPRALRGDYEPGFAIAHFTKDLQIAIRCAERLGLSLPGLSLAKRLYDELAAEGAGAKGTQVLLRRYLEQLAGRPG